MNARLSKSLSGSPIARPSALPTLPLALRASVGADGGGGGKLPPGRVQPPAPPAPQPTRGGLQALVSGQEWGQHPRAMEMAQMAVAVGAQGLGGDMVNPQKCLPNYPNQVVQSMAGIFCDLDNLPPGVDKETAKWFMSQVNLAKYAVAPTRLGWLCDSISYVTPAIGNAPVVAANAVVGAINITPTRSFTMDAFVMASGTANDPLYFVTAFSYQGTNFVGTGPWISTLYKPESGCCLCVRVIPIIEKNTTVTVNITNGNQANVFLFGELFGYTLFSGSP